MNSIPVVVFAYNRPEHLERALCCLRENSIPALYIYVDGPRNGDGAATSKAIRSAIDHIDWIDPQVVYRDTNLGLSRSIRQGLDEVFAKHSAAVVVEDDVWVAPQFYSFVTQALQQYADEPRVAGVTGVRHPFETRAFDRYRWDAFFFPRFSSWGWGTWARWWRALDFDRARLAERLLTPRIHPDDAALGFLSRVYLDGSLSGSWDVAAALNMLADGRYFVYPRWNLVENGGHYDGEHPVKGWMPWTLEWEEGRQRFVSAVAFPPAVELDRRISRAYRRLLGPSPQQGGRGLRTVHAVRARLRSWRRNDR